MAVPSWRSAMAMISPQWDAVLIPFPADLNSNFAKPTVWAEGTEVIAVIRGSTAGNMAWVATSIDGGRTWTEARRSNMPMPAAKAYLGKLSTGQMYMVSNLRNPNTGKSRDTLTVSVSKPGETTLSSMWRTRYGSSSPIPRFSGSAKSAQWSYPYGYIHDGKLYIVYSIGKEDCGLTVIPISSLATAP